MKRIFLYAVALVALIVTLPCMAQQPADTVPSAPSAAARLSTPHPSTGATVTVYHDPAIEQMIRRRETERLREVKGFRIQIFSGNRGTTSRNRAFEIKDLLLEKEPTLEVYVTYTSPFWKVRVGNCASHEKAQELRAWMIEQFPDFATETYIVPSTVLVP